MSGERGEARPYRVLFVCTGSICRSPMAVGAFRGIASRTGVAHRFRVGAAALRDCHAGRPADPRAIAAALRRGYRLAGHRARQIEPADFAGQDLIVGMGAWHVERLREVASPGSCRVRSLVDYAGGCEADEVPDPYRGPISGFETALDLIEAGCTGLVRSLSAPRAVR